MTRLVKTCGRSSLLRGAMIAAVGGLLALSLASVVRASPAEASEQAGSAAGGGLVHRLMYEADTGANEYLVYTPRGWNRNERFPLYVMLHGCGTTAEQQMHANLLNPLADQERFVVVYPDNGGQCWRAVSAEAASITRGGGGDADIVAGITRAVTADFHADAERVYVMGMSSGAFQASAAAAAYPDLYAAAGVMAGGGYAMDFTCMVLPDLADVVAGLYAPRTVQQMGPRAHVMPFLAIGGTTDPLGETPLIGGCSRQAYREWMIANNLLMPGSSDVFRDDPALTVTGRVPDGHAWTMNVATDRGGCQIAERWIVDGMGHFWSGGSTDLEYAGEFNDPRGPSASEASWNFFKKFTLHEGNTTC